MEYGERLNAALKARGKSRQWLADRIGISVQAVGMVIRGESKALDAVNHSRACDLLEVSPLWLAAGEGHMDARRLSFSDLSPYESAFIALVREGLTEEEFLGLHQATLNAVKTKKAKLQQGLQVGEIGVYFAQDRRHHDEIAVREQRITWSEVERETRLRESSK